MLPNGTTEDLRPCIMRNQVWHSTLSELHPLDLAQLVFCLLGRDAVDCEAAFRIVDKTEVFAGLLDRYHVHVASGVCDIGADSAIDFDETLHEDGADFTAVECILETVLV